MSHTPPSSANGDSINLFEDDKYQVQWLTITDNVMGGISSSDIRKEDEKLIFDGNVSLDNNGGFASIRRAWRLHQNNAKTGIKVTVKGDGKRYQLRFRTNYNWDGLAYMVAFNTTNGETETFEFLASEFKASYRGRTITDVPAFDFSNARQLGFLIGAKQTGVFRLEIESLKLF